MPKQVMMINVTHAEESRVAIVAEGVLETFEIETFDYKSQKGNIYKAKVESIHTGLQAAFVDIGAPRSGFLPLDELNFKVNPAKNGHSGRMEHHLHRGQEILVQVVRDAYGTKPPTLSTYFSLPGRYLVLTPYADSAGVSRKLDDENRDRLRKTLDGLPIPENMGVIVRTAGATASKTELARDLKYLLRLWERVEEGAAHVRGPKLIYQERSLVIRAVRDLFTPEIDEILVDDPKTHQEILDFFEVVLPNKKSIVKLYQGDRPIFNKYNLEEQIENIFRRRVPLPSGGAVIFDTTEALTAIDVNSGKMRSEGGVEDTAFKTNVEAAEEIGRQLRLRDLGGLVVIDFIDMRAAKNQRAVEKKVKDSLKKDKARYDITKLSRLGLLEISRERLNPEKSSLRYTDCPHCEGMGSIKTLEAAAVQVIRRLQTRVVRGDLEMVEISVPVDVAEYLLNHKRGDIVGWEERYKTRIVIKVDASMIRDGCEIRAVERERSQHSGGPVVSAPTHSEILEGIDDIELEREIAAAAAASAAERNAESDDEEGSESSEGGKKRRRRRRGGRRHRKRKDETQTAGAAADGGEVAASTPEADDEEDHDDSDSGEPSADESAAGEESGDGSTGGGKRKRRRRRRRRGKGGGEAGAENGETPSPAAAAQAEKVAVASAAPAPALAVRAPIIPTGGDEPAPRMGWWKLLIAADQQGEHSDNGEDDAAAEDHDAGAESFDEESIETDLPTAGEILEIDTEVEVPIEE